MKQTYCTKVTRDYERKIKLRYILLIINRLLKIQHQPVNSNNFFLFPLGVRVSGAINYQFPSWKIV